MHSVQDKTKPAHPECGLREEKRLRTRHALTDAATSLVLERGHSAVNIEDICTMAGISRRTFFNYFDTKDQAIFGARLLCFDEDDIEDFVSARHNNVVQAIFEAVEMHYAAEVEDPTPLQGLESWGKELRRRRREILNKDPALASAVLANFNSAMQHIRVALTRYFTKFPDDRVYAEVSMEEEVTFTLGIIIECILFVSLHADDQYNSAPLQDAAEKLKIFTRRFQW